MAVANERQEVVYATRNPDVIDSQNRLKGYFHCGSTSLGNLLVGRLYTWRKYCLHLGAEGRSASGQIGEGVKPRSMLSKGPRGLKTIK